MPRLYLFLWASFLFCPSCVPRTIQKENVFKETKEKTNFSMEDFFRGTFSSASFNGTWLSEHTFLYKNGNGDYLKYDAKTKNASVFIESDVLASYSGASITVSKDELYVLISYNVSSVFRHSTTSIYTVYSINEKKYYHVNNQTAVQMATLAPSGHGLAYVYKNNIYYVSDVTKMDEPDQVTTDGVENVVYCGVPDWVYEEEVLGSGSALWFSPNGERIAYAQFNDTEVEDFYYFIYGTPGSLEDQYPTLQRIKYPKVGTPNPVVNTFVYDVEQKSTMEFQLPGSIHNKENDNDYVLYDISWVSDSEVAMISTNRIQNESVVLRCDAENGQCLEEVSYKQPNGWLTPAIPKYNKDGTQRLEILPQPVGDDTFNHLVLTDIPSNQRERLTFGNKVVTGIYSWDQDNGKVYYVGSANGMPSQQQAYVVNIVDKTDTCLTCNMLVEGIPCSYATASVSPDNSYFVKICYGPTPTLAAVQNVDDESDSFVWEDNQSVRGKLEEKNIPQIKKLVVPLNNEFTANVKLLLPPNFDEFSTKKYPAIVYVYAGPDTNGITDANSYAGIQNYWVTEKEYIYIYIDGRGSGRDGNKKTFQVYRNLATVEIEDQITVIKYLHGNCPYIDAERTAIWGWSYGGFATGWTLVKDTENHFKCGLSVAPVTSFIYYDTIYTERYMGLPSDNELGYNNTDLSRNVEALRGKKYFLIHGNADDNVHYQQSMVLSKALEHADILFRQQSYPDENHSLGHRLRHLYHTIDKYWADCFNSESTRLSRHRSVIRKER